MNIRCGSRFIAVRSILFLAMVLICSRIAGQAAPVLASLSPASIPAGTTGFSLAVNGTGFVSGSRMLWNDFGIYTSTTFVSDTQLQATVSDSVLKSQGSANITVQNPDGSVSNTKTFTITAAVTSNPVPVLASVSPSSATAGGPTFTLMVTGSNFIGGSVVEWGATALNTNFVSGTQLTASVPASDIATAGTVQITVVNPTPGGGPSAPVPFTINAAPALTNPTPRITWMSPFSASAGGPSFNLTVYGANFTSGSVVQWNGDLPTQFVNSNQLTALVPASYVAKPGLVEIAVFNPTPGGGTSGAWTYPIASSGVTNFAGGPLPPALAPAAVAVDSGLGLVYAVHRALFNDVQVNTGLLPSDVVTVADQKTGNVITTIGVGETSNGQGQGIAVYSTSTIHLIFVPTQNAGGGAVSVIDGTANTVVATIAVPGASGSIAVDSTIGVVYVAAGSSVTLLDAANKGAVLTSIPVGGQVIALVTDSTSHLGYALVGTTGSGMVVAIDGAARAIRTQTSLPPYTLPIYTAIAVDPGTRLYGCASGTASGTVVPLDITGSVPVVLNGFGGTSCYALAVDPNSHLVYVADNSHAVSIWSSTGTRQKTIGVLRAPVAITVDQSSNRAYVADNQSGSLSVLDTQQQAVVSTIPLATVHWGLAFDSSSKILYSANFGADAVSVVNAVTQKVTASWNSGGGTFWTAVDPGVQQVYALNSSDGTLSIFSSVDGSLKTPLSVGKTTLSLGKDRVSNGTAAVNLTTHTVYVSTGGGSVTVINGGTNQIVSPPIAVGGSIVGIAIDEVAGLVYVANHGSGSINVINAGTNQVVDTWKLQTPPIWRLAIDPALKKLYVTLPSGGFVGAFSGLAVLDTSNHGALIAQIPSGQPAVVPVAVDADAENVVVNPATHHVFLGDSGNGTVTVVDGSTNAVLGTLVTGTGAIGMAVDKDSGLVYVSNFVDGTISVFSDQFAPAQNPVPTISQLSPSSITAGGAAFQLTVTGSNFVNGAVVQWGGSTLTPISVSGSQLTVSIPATDIVSAGSVPVTVVNPSPGGGTSSVLTFTITTTSTPPPQVNPGGVVNGGSFGNQPPAPASIGSLFGVNLASSTVVATTVPLPTSLGGVSVQINGVSVPLFFVSSTQINFQFPWELLGQTTVTITISINGQTSAPQTVTLAPSGPAIFATNSQGTGQGAIQIANTTTFAAPVGSISGAETRPARNGEFITIYCTGLGNVTNRPATGVAASGNPLSATAAPTVTIGGVSAAINFSGLAPGFVGLYQVNVQVPNNAPAGDAVPVIVIINGASSNTVTIAVQ